MVIDTLAPLVDVQPAFDALTELKDQSGLRSPEAKAFLRSKVRECVKSLRETAGYLEDQLRELPKGR